METWIKLNTNSSAHWQDNISVAAKRHPSLSIRVESALERVTHYDFMSVSNDHYGVRCEENGQPFLLYDPQSIDRKLKAMGLRAEEWIKRGSRLAAIMGSGIGRLALNLLQRIQQVEPRMLLLVEPRAELIAAQWMLYDCRTLLESSQVFWAVHEDIFTELGRVFHEESLLALNHEEIVPLPERELTPAERAGFQTFGSWYSTKRQEYIHSFQEKRNRYEHSLSQPPNLKNGVVWGAGMPDAYAHTPLIESLLSGFEASDFEKRYIQLRPGPTFLAKISAHIIDACPDVYLIIHTPSKSYIEPEVKRPRVIWYLDHPNHFYWDEYRRQFFEWDYIFYSDRTYRPHFEQTSAGGYDYLPVCPSIRRVGTVRPGMAAPIMFVGNYTPVSHLLGQLSAKNKDEIYAWLEFRIANATQNALQSAEASVMPESTLHAMRKASGLYTEQLSRPFQNENDRLEYFCYALANSYKRERYITALLDLGIVVYGPESWLLLLGEKHAAQYRGWLSNEELPDAYASASLCLNIHSLQCPTCLNCRDFDILMANGVLVGDDVEDAHRGLIEPCRDFVLYGSVDELRAKVTELLEDEEKRRTIQEQGHRTFLENHTSAHRAQIIIDTLQKRYEVR